ncbi:hypothetical protein TRM7557_00763 [Tritonibacter multivorans]|uniref:Immunity MXAN-0049 protein domain-containing protein n=1 Tax=Tritonibacter multivorans TaxID=928856 RepID=A0A0P1G2Z7_9RHOB|nr:DUF1629 domain-containing protein [Tritonibacter multivorans]MDA7419800.1 hypothetical protein [Tritonibacter multivorans]CUH76200.1 hypothetical protein TRM7557_00763 [Tritonibacter multivorans]SFC53371.1 hypothetical protein SAMN04488049_10317 [Tritonibacter multivorans]
MTYIFHPMGPGNIVGVATPEWDAEFGIIAGEDHGAAALSGVFRYGLRSLKCNEVPQRLIANETRKKWYDSFLITGSLSVVREPVKDIIEGLDPGVHQFFPLTIETKRGKMIEGPWFAMNVTARQDSVVMEQSSVNVNKRFPDELCSFFHDGEDRVTVDAGRQSGLHLWREQRFRGSLLGSDALMAELKAQKLRFFPRAFRALDLLVEAD